ncbi:hypothetical protein QBC34DRAFT_212855 [Podospora aff. communis PSN243]|uniref:Uncharacterized protein n=1 Tax=Podospora aff. communis PSN243 TaxID=3040156 RepID=A0AAV9G6S8_9PEZI|nr:hypothetical protein QBC34DRAFT_212855 [Podospora aff. communis PSN243]
MFGFGEPGDMSNWLQKRNENGQFFSPSNPRQAWRIGETQNITFDTRFQSYNIAIWQQYRDGKGAELGPILMNVSCPSNNCMPMQGFTWEVQTYDFDLDVSDTFLLWMFNGTDPTAQGNTKIPNISSGYFTILEAKAQEPEPPTASTTSFSTAATSATQSSTPATLANFQPPAPGDNPNNMFAAIGAVVSIFAVAAISGTLAWLLWRKKRRTQALASKPNPEHEVDSRPLHVEMGDSPVVEMSSTSSEGKPASSWGTGSAHPTDAKESRPTSRNHELGARPVQPVELA